MERNIMDTLAFLVPQTNAKNTPSDRQIYLSNQGRLTAGDLEQYAATLEELLAGEARCVVKDYTIPRIGVNVRPNGHTTSSWNDRLMEVINPRATSLVYPYARQVRNAGGEVEGTIIRLLISGDEGRLVWTIPEGKRAPVQSVQFSGPGESVVYTPDQLTTPWVHHLEIGQTAGSDRHIVIEFGLKTALQDPDELFEIAEKVISRFNGVMVSPMEITDPSDRRFFPAPRGFSRQM